MILAVLASPPYYEGSTNDNGGTYWGITKSSSDTTSNGGGFSISAGIGAEFDSGIFGNSGFEFETSITNSFNWATANTKEVNETYGYNIGVGEESVIFTAIPYYCYYYQTITMPDYALADDVDQSAVSEKIITSMVPRKPGRFSMERRAYNYYTGATTSLAGDEPNPDSDVWPVILKHDLGVPSSYYTKGDMSNLKKLVDRDALKDINDDIADKDFYGLFSTNADMHAGVSDTGNSILNVSTVASTDKSFDYELSLDMELKIKIAGVTASVGAGASYQLSTTNTVSNGIEIEGDVPDISKDFNEANTPELFNWGLVMFPTSSTKLDPTGSTGKTKQAFNLVTYWVSPNSN
jgi:hypothetical protein